MRREIVSFVRRLRRDESGAVIVLVAISIVVLIGLTGLLIDLGNLYYAQRRLQVTTDIAALSAALDINHGAAGTAITTAQAYGAASGGSNVQPGLSVTMPTPALKCLSGIGIYYNQTTKTCTGSDAANAIEVTAASDRAANLRPVVRRPLGDTLGDRARERGRGIATAAHHDRPR